MALITMWLRILIAISYLSSSSLAAPPPPPAPGAGYAFSPADVRSGKALASLAQTAHDNAIARLTKAKGSACATKNLKVRREWRTLAPKDRQSFIAAVKCLRNKPSVYPPGVVPGSKSYYDDFIAVHLNQTLTIHCTGTFLTWHRYYTWWYEKQLNACGYDGTVPYWDWGADAGNIENSPIFDGSSTSLGGNGKFVPHAGMMMPQPIPPTVISLPPGTGGGCVTTGPFGALTMRLGPVQLPDYGDTNTSAVANPLGDNFRCLKRDLNNVALAGASYYNTTSLILDNQDVEHFQAIMQGDGRYVTGSLGVHGSGHYTIGGDPGSDPYISPGDPAFFLHHSQVDRIYWIWQELDWQHRQTVHGNTTFMGFLPGDTSVTLDTEIDLGVLGAPPVKTRDLLSTIADSSSWPACYVYV